MATAHERMMGAPRRYEASIDRVGIALAVGSMLGGCLILGLFLLGDQRDPIALAAVWAMGSVFTGFGITAVAGPLWLAMHVAGLRRARHAAAVGAIVAMAIFVGAQTYGFGFLEMPPMDNQALLYRWISALLIGVFVGVAAAGIGVAMWRIAYRRES